MATSVPYGGMVELMDPTEEATGMDLEHFIMSVAVVITMLGMGLFFFLAVTGVLEHP